MLPKETPITMTDFEELKEQLERMKVQAKSTSQENELVRKTAETLTGQNNAFQQKPLEKACEATQTEQGNNNNSSNNSNRPKPQETLTREVNNIQETQNSAGNNEFIQGILTHFQNLQVNIVLPTFEVEKENSIRFLERLEKYFLRKSIRRIKNCY